MSITTIRKDLMGAQGDTLVPVIIHYESPLKAECFSLLRQTKDRY